MRLSNDKSAQKTIPEIIAIRKKFISSFYAGNKGLFWLTVFTMILMGLFNVVISYVFKLLVDYMSDTNQHDLTSILLNTLLASAGFIIFYMMMRTFRAKFLYRAMRQYNEYAFSEIIKKNISSFTGENSSTYISALTVDATTVTSNYVAELFILIDSLVAMVASLIMLIYYSPLLTCVAIVLSLAPVLVSILVGNQLVETEKAVSNETSVFMATVKDLLSGFTVIKSFKAEKEVQQLFNKSNDTLAKVKTKRRLAVDLVNLLSSIAGLIAQFGVFFVSAYLTVTSGILTVGTALFFLNSMNFIIQPINTVPPMLANRKAALALIDKLATAVLHNVRFQGETIPPVLSDSIKFNDVKFGYESDSLVLKGINATFESGKSYAIVGGSGSGKSTMLQLLMGATEGFSGSITFDGHDVKSISTDSLYDIVSIIEQNVFVFNSTLKNNLTMFHEFSDEELNRAIAMSGLSDLVSERGLDYECGENGSGLSGGERQRVSIARSLLRGTPVLLMDEATAALDASTAHAVSNSILDISGLTRIIITHRLDESVMRRYDQILVLRGGIIYECGTFEELMAKQEYFYSLFNVANAD